MILSDLIKEQIFESIIMLMAGIGVGALYSLFVFCKGIALPAGGSKRAKLTGLFAAAAEILFWIFAAVYITGFLGYAAYGELSIHAFLMMFCGVLLWKRLFYGTIKY